MMIAGLTGDERRMCLLLLALTGLGALTIAVPGRWDPIGVHGLLVVLLCAGAAACPSSDALAQTGVLISGESCSSLG